MKKMLCVTWTDGSTAGENLFSLGTPFHFSGDRLIVGNHPATSYFNWLHVISITVEDVEDESI